MQEITCERCGEVFLPKVVARGVPRRFCTVQCQQYRPYSAKKGEALRRWRTSRPDLVLAWGRSEKQHANVRRYYYRHPERAREHSRVHCGRRRARQSGYVVHHTVAEWRSLVDECGGRCLYCGLVKTLERDHLIPLGSPGSSDLIENIVPACRSCNGSKGARSLVQWLAVRGAQIS